MSRAFEKLHGVGDAFGQVEVSGRSDTAIFLEAARAHSVREPQAALGEFVDAYALQMDVALKETAGALMPGVEAALAALEARNDVVQGLGTGNFRRTSEAKLRHYGIADYFPACVGGFGDDHEQRDELIRIGIGRLCENDRRNGDRIVIVGDTPHDVVAARANNAFCLAVATGKDTVDDLMAAGADVVLQDLSDTARVIEILVDYPG